MMAKAKERRTIPCGEFERKISLGGFGRSKFREWNKMAEIFACREKGPWPSTPLDTSGGPASRWHNTRPPFGLIKGIAWHEMQLFLHATTPTPRILPFVSRPWRDTRRASLYGEARTLLNGAPRPPPCNGTTLCTWNVK